MPRYVVTYETVGAQNVQALNSDEAMKHTLRSKPNARVLAVEEYELYWEKLRKLKKRREAIEASIDDPNVFALQNVMEEFREEDNKADGVSAPPTGCYHD